MPSRLCSLYRNLRCVRADLEALRFSRCRDTDADTAYYICIFSRLRTVLQKAGHPAAGLVQSIIDTMGGSGVWQWRDTCVEDVVRLCDEYVVAGHCLPDDVRYALSQLLHDAKYHNQHEHALADARMLLETMIDLAQHLELDVAGVLQEVQRRLEAERPSEDDVNLSLKALRALSGVLEERLAREPSERVRTRPHGPIEEILIVEDDLKWSRWTEKAALDAVDELGLPVTLRACTEDLRTWLEGNRPADGEPWRILVVLDLALPRHYKLEQDERAYTPVSWEGGDPPSWRNTHQTLLELFPGPDEPPPPIIVLSSHAELLDEFTQWVDRQDYVSKDLESLEDLQRTRGVLEARIRDHVEPLRAAQCEMRLLGFSGCQAIFNGVQVRLTHEQYGALSLLAGADVRDRPRPTPLGDLVQGALMSEHFSITGDKPAGFWDDPIQYLWGNARRALRSISQQVPASLWPADPMLSIEGSGADRAIELCCPSMIVRYPREARDVPFRVLIVEDDHTDREWLEAHLGSHFPVTAVRDGDELELALAQGDYAAVVLDLEFPDANGRLLEGPSIGIEWHGRLLRSRNVRYVVVYSRHDHPTVRGRLDKTYQRVRGIHWDELCHPPDIVAKRGRRGDEGATIIAHLCRAERDYHRRSSASPVEEDPLSMLVSLREESQEDRLDFPSNLDDLARTCAFLLNGYPCVPCQPISKSQKSGPRQSAIREPWWGYNVLHYLASAPGAYCSKYWLSWQLVKDGVLELPISKSIDRKWLAHAIACVREGAEKVLPGAGDIISQYEGAYCLNARVELLDPDAWETRRRETLDVDR